MLRSMWVTRSLARAGRRLRPVAEPPADQIPEQEIRDLTLTLVRADLERLFTGLATSLDPHMRRPDSPALLAGALGSAIARCGGDGRPTVTRSPAGLHTPEYWHIRVEGADTRTRDAIDRLTAGGRIP